MEGSPDTAEVIAALVESVNKNNEFLTGVDVCGSADLVPINNVDHPNTVSSGNGPE